MNQNIKGTKTIIKQQIIHKITSLDLQSGRYPVLLGVLFTNKLTNINEKMINYWRHNFFYLVHILPLF